MRIEIADKMRTRNLKIFFSISLGVHLIVFSVLTLLYPDFKIDRILPLHIEVSLLPSVPPEVAKERPKLKAVSLPPVRAQMRKAEEESLRPSLQGLSGDTSVEEEKPLPQPRKEEKTERGPVPVAMASLLPWDLDSNTWSDEKPFFDIGSHEGSRIVSKRTPPLNESTIFVQPRYAENPRPFYPQEARKKGYEGEVFLKVEVLANGRVGRVEVKKSSGYEILDRSALAAVKQWRFIPANEGNGAIPCWVNIPIKFKLQ